MLHFVCFCLCVIFSVYGNKRNFKNLEIINNKNGGRGGSLFLFFKYNHNNVVSWVNERRSLIGLTCRSTLSFYRLLGRAAAHMTQKRWKHVRSRKWKFTILESAFAIFYIFFFFNFWTEAFMDFLYLKKIWMRHILKRPKMGLKRIYFNSAKRKIYNKVWYEKQIMTQKIFFFAIKNFWQNVRIYIPRMYPDTFKSGVFFF